MLEPAMSQMEAFSRRCGLRASLDWTCYLAAEVAQEDNPQKAWNPGNQIFGTLPNIVPFNPLRSGNGPQFLFRVSSESISFAMTSHTLGSFSIW